MAKLVPPPLWSRAHDAIVLLAVSLVFEVTVLSKIEIMPNVPPAMSRVLFHLQHLALMSTNVASIYMRGGPHAMTLAFGATCTLFGDYVNSALSRVEPCSEKLTWALILFGVGYSCYTAALWRAVQQLQERRGAAHFIVAVAMFAINIHGWATHLSPVLEPFPLLHYGSLAFDLSIYVALTTLGVWFAMATRFSALSLLILVSTVLIPFSDLILFASWFHGKVDPLTPSTDQYAQNWLLYFSGQVLFGLLPLAVVDAARSADARSRSTMALR